MRLSRLFLYANIKNYEAPICQNCIHYRPALFVPSFSKCSQFGEKDLITGDIKYSFADLSRTYDDKCGLEGKLYSPSSLPIRAVQYVFINKLPTTVLTIIFFMIIFSKDIKR